MGYGVQKIAHVGSNDNYVCVYYILLGGNVYDVQSFK